jgi:hypothetical protein
MAAAAPGAEAEDVRVEIRLEQNHRHEDEVRRRVAAAIADFLEEGEFLGGGVHSRLNFGGGMRGRFLHAVSLAIVTESLSVWKQELLFQPRWGGGMEETLISMENARRGTFRACERPQPGEMMHSPAIRQQGRPTDWAGSERTRKVNS